MEVIGAFMDCGAIFGGSSLCWFSERLVACASVLRDVCWGSHGMVSEFVFLCHSPSPPFHDLESSRTAHGMTSDGVLKLITHLMQRVTFKFTF